MSNKSVPRPRLLSLATALPAHCLNQSSIKQFGEALFSQRFREFERLIPVYDNAAIESRYSCVPLDWYAGAHAFKDRNALFVKNAIDLLEQAADRALASAGLDPAAIDGVVAVSTSGIATPSLDALIVERMRLRRNVERLPIFGLGCAGGVIGLARAGQMAISRPGALILFLVVELCGLTFRSNDFSKSNVIATALFGDGAAAAVLSTAPAGKDESYVLRAWGEHTWPSTLDVMGWNIENDGFGVLFSRDIPAIVRRDYRAALDAFLANNQMALDDIEGFALHPGGAKVIDALADVMGLGPDALKHSRDVLRDFGNMSAVTVLFVLDRLLSTNERPERILMSSLGPGFTVGFSVLERT